MQRASEIRSARVVAGLVSVAISATVLSLSLTSSSASAQAEGEGERWTVFVDGTNVNKATRIGTDPDTEFHSLSITTTRGQASFNFTIEPDGSITQTGGNQAYHPDPTWHLEGSYDGVEFNCDPPVEVPEDFGSTEITGTVNETEMVFNLDIPDAREHNDEMECSRNFTAFAADLQHLRDSLLFCGEVRVALADYGTTSCRKSQITVGDISSPTQGRIKREITHRWDLTFRRIQSGEDPPTPSPSGTIPSPTPSGTGGPGPSPTEPPSTNPRRSLMVLQRHLAASGAITLATWAAPECVASVPVRVQRRAVDGSWRTVRSVTTDASGLWSTRLRDRKGRYRAFGPEVVKGQATCNEAVSGIKRHNHRR